MWWVYALGMERLSVTEFSHTYMWTNSCQTKGRRHEYWLQPMRFLWAMWDAHMFTCWSLWKLFLLSPSSSPCLQHGWDVLTGSCFLFRLLTLCKDSLMFTKAHVCFKVKRCGISWRSADLGNDQGACPGGSLIWIQCELWTPTTRVQSCRAMRERMNLEMEASFLPK